MPEARDILYAAAKKIIQDTSSSKEEAAELLIELEDDLPSQHELESLAYPSGVNDGTEDQRRFLCNHSTQSGAYLILGDYESPNRETWKHQDRLKFGTFDEVEQSVREFSRIESGPATFQPK